MFDKNKIPFFAFFSFLFFSFLRKKESDVAIKTVNIINELAKHPTKVYNTRSLSQINKLILHHFASDGTPYAVANYHVNNNDWAGIGYHYVIAKDGTIYQTNLWETLSYHVSGQNTNSLGIALEGNFKNEIHLPEQLQSLRKLIPFLRGKFNQPLEVYQHSDFANKPYDANLDLTEFKLGNIGIIYPDYNNSLYECKDGAFTDSTAKGYCSHHGGEGSELDNISDIDVQSFFYKDFYIAEYLMNSKIRVKDFYNYGGRKSDVKHKLHYFAKSGTPLDTDAQSISDSLGIEVTPEDIIDAVQSYGSGKEFMEDLKWKTLDMLKRQHGIGATFQKNKFYNSKFIFNESGVLQFQKGKKKPYARRSKQKPPVLPRRKEQPKKPPVVLQQPKEQPKKKPPVVLQQPKKQPKKPPVVFQQPKKEKQGKFFEPKPATGGKTLFTDQPKDKKPPVVLQQPKKEQPKKPKKGLPEHIEREVKELKESIDTIKKFLDDNFKYFKQYYIVNIIIPKSEQPNNYAYSPYIAIKSTLSGSKFLSAPLTDFFKLAIGEPNVYAYLIKVHSYSLSALLKHIKTFKPLPHHLPKEQPKKPPVVLQQPKEQPKKKPPVVLQQPKKNTKEKPKHADLEQIKVTEGLIKDYFFKFNTTYFDDNLTLPPIKFKRLKGVTAYVTIGRSRTDSIVKSLTFNPGLGYNLETFKGILLHEMIHIYFGENNIRSGKDGHGKEFLAERKKLQKIAPFYIPLIAEGLEISIHNNKPKYFDIILAHYPNKTNPYQISVFKNGLLSNQEGNLKDRFKRTILQLEEKNEKGSLIVYRSNYLQLQDYTATGKLKRMSFYEMWKITENRFNRAIEHGTVLYTVFNNLYKKSVIPKVRTYKITETLIVKAYAYQDNIKPLIETVKTTEEASIVFRQWIENNDLGGSEIKGGQAIIYKNSKKFKRVSYNGKIWDLDEPIKVKYEIVCVKILNKEKGFREDEVCFNSYIEAETWARKNLERFSHDFLYYKDSDKPALPVKDTKKEPEEIVPATKITSDYELSSFTHSKTGVVHDLVKILPDIGQDNFRKLKSIVKNDYEGFYSRYAKGFMFPVGKGSIFMNFDLSSLDGNTTLTDTPKQKKSKKQNIPFYLQKFTIEEEKEMIEMGKNVADIIKPEDKKQQQAYMKNPVFLSSYLGYIRFKLNPEQQKQDTENNKREGYSYRHGMFYKIPEWLQKKLAVQWFKYFFPDVKRVTANFNGYKGFNLKVKLNEEKIGEPFSKEFLEKERKKRNEEMSKKGKEILEMFNGGYVDHYSDYPWNFSYSVGVEIN